MTGVDPSTFSRTIPLRNPSRRPGTGRISGEASRLSELRLSTNKAGRIADHDIEQRGGDADISSRLRPRKPGRRQGRVRDGGAGCSPYIPPPSSVSTPTLKSRRSSACHSCLLTRKPYRRTLHSGEEVQHVFVRHALEQRQCDQPVIIWETTAASKIRSTRFTTQHSNSTAFLICPALSIRIRG
jgi:hypothetical protein